ncbi:hypothetical protein FA10DRAFT_269004 [Acaromyces ingoldii]|uniref:CHRD domain-containing protein n=1 Tax=Acaromyces ingoldii TaxID=215250 RepID=A0A316YEZ5_9BASI|nr:hypothetical protein FA10DRAFT_269004 [Acaromyces ingoldii]PWN87681.1 hypothetical protein FA10DRAFT_269004 [Acaromyces ingoldii]
MKTAIALALLAGAASAAPAVDSEELLSVRSNKLNYCGRPSYFTSAFHTRAVNTTVVDAQSNPVAGEAGAFGQYALEVNSDKDVICWDITLVGVTGEYSSPARTATHIHQAPKGKAGPPRIAFPNPEFVEKNAAGQEVRKSSGCAKAPFVTGIKVAGTETDTGSASGFTLKQIEADPSAFFADTHTAKFTAGAVRGQLLASERTVKAPRHFTSVVRTTATPDQVISNAGVATPGEPGAKASYELKINSNEDILCYDIVTSGVTGAYSSPAKTATHTHEAAVGKAGPPRIAFKNPAKVSKWSVQHIIHKLKNGNKELRRSKACVKGPFTTGLNDATTGIDTGSASGFSLKKLEANPSAFFADTHTVKYTNGAVRGQLK